MYDLTDEEIARYGRQIIVPGVGGEGQERLKRGSVLAVGAGGLGSPSLLYLAAAGVGRIGIIDADAVDVTNLQRQIAHTTVDLGRNKAESAAETLRAINPLIEAVTYTERLDAGNAPGILGEYDVIIDGTDNFPTRYLINDACVLLGKPLVTAAILRYSGQVTVVLPGETACYRCLFPEPPAPGAVPSCSQAGILGPVAGVMGSIQALEAIKLLLGTLDTLAGRFVVFDFLSLESQVMELRRNEGCAVCGDTPTITTLHVEQDSCVL
ncbi:MAG: HesA/MoeB/ThiF family protein [Coriobacteriia bacterium]